jgi:hypothetical protein
VKVENSVSRFRGPERKSPRDLRRPVVAMLLLELYYTRDRGLRRIYPKKP